MQVRVVLFGGARVVVGRSGVDLSFDLPFVTVGQLVEELIATYPRVQPYLQDASGMLNSSLRVLINKERPVPDATLATVVYDGDEVTFLVAVAGGAQRN
jgi:molybdopterin converting factor small subunit